MKFLADMGISPTTVAFLRSLNHEAIHLHEEQLDHLPDPVFWLKPVRKGALCLPTTLTLVKYISPQQGKFAECGYLSPERYASGIAQ